MNMLCHIPAGRRTGTALSMLALFALALFFSGCASKSPAPDAGGTQGAAGATGPSTMQLAYGISVTMPPSYTVAGSLTAQAAPKDNLDSRRKSGERILMLEAAGTPSQRNIEPMLALFLVNQEGTFMPREYAERIKPEELDAIGRELLAKEKAEAKKNKKSSGLLDLKINRETVNGKVAIVQRMLVAGPDGQPARLSNWDIYLPDGAGIAVKSVYDQEAPGTETEINNIVHSLRTQ